MEREVRMLTTRQAAAALAIAPKTLKRWVAEGRIAYVRLRAETYSPEQRDGWLQLLERESQGRDVYVFAKHEGTAPTDPAGGVGLAVWLRSAAGRPAAPLP